jgi:formamidopyrimidine-DNA glycosylase
MPELPEVETIVRDLRDRIIDKKIKDAEVLLPRIVKTRNFCNTIIGNKLKRVERVGKMLVFELERGGYMIVHLKMTGQLIYHQKKQVIAGGHSERKDEPSNMPNKWTRVIFRFSDNSKLFFNDLRTFGYIKIVNGMGLAEASATYGLEPFSKEFNLNNFKKIFKNRKTTIKALLLNQKLIAGLGNIYVDEVLFAAGVLPDRRVDALKEAEIKKIYSKINPILTNAIKNRGTTFNNYVDPQGKKGGMKRRLKVYGRTGKKCVNCGNIIMKRKIAGRGTHYCLECQK